MKQSPMTEEQLIQYIQSGDFQDGQVLRSTITKKRYRVRRDNRMPSSFEELETFSTRPRFKLEEVK